MDLNGLKEEIETLCGRSESKMAPCTDSLGHPVLLISGCLPEDADYKVIFNPFEAKEEDIGRTGAHIWVFEIKGDEIFQYESQHNKSQADRVLRDQGRSALKRLAWIVENLHPRFSRSGLSTG